MAQIDRERFRRLAEECQLQAEQATSPMDKAAWWRLAKDWMRLANNAEPGNEGR
jgi:hypothetical protein